jgi:hypothetical protein
MGLLCRMNQIKSLIIYPPKVYARIPYLAPFLLKGYIEKSSLHKVHCLDLNIRFHKSVWTGEIFKYSGQNQLTSSQISRIKIVKQWGSKAYETMRTQENYDETVRKLLEDANEVLYRAEELEAEVSQSFGSSQEVFPYKYNDWDQLTAKSTKSLAARFICDEFSNFDIGNYDVIGFSCSYIEQLQYCFLSSHILKSKYEFDGKLVIGGSGFTHIHEFALEDDSFWRYFDYGIPYEGEVTFLELLNGVANDNEEFKNKNVISFDGYKTHFINAIRERPVVHSVPDFSTLEHLYPTPKPIYPVLTSKGCYWGKCTFCTHHEGYGQGYSPAHNSIISESVSHVAGLGGHHFYFVDEALPAVKIKYLAELFSDLQEQHKISPPRWMAECRVEKYSADEKYLRILKESGCRLLISGMETGSQRIMDLMKKGVQISHAQEYARNCRKIGIQTAWMFFIGFPGETLEESKETFDLIEKCKFDINYATVGTFGLERGAPVWNNYTNFGIEEILGRDDPYRVVYDYRYRDGTIRQRSDLKDVFRVFLDYYPDHYELFTRIIDRSCALFFDYKDEGSISDEF